MGSNQRPNTNQGHAEGELNTSVSVQMVVSESTDVNALSLSRLHVKPEGNINETPQ